MHVASDAFRIIKEMSTFRNVIYDYIFTIGLKHALFIVFSSKYK